MTDATFKRTVMLSDLHGQHEFKQPADADFSDLMIIVHCSMNSVFDDLAHDGDYIDPREIRWKVDEF